MSQQQLGRGPLRSDGEPPVPPGGASETARFVGWLGNLGCAAAGYAVFQFLFGVLPGSIGSEAAKYLIAGVSGVGTGVAAWLAAALVRARAAAAVPATRTAVVVARTEAGPLPRLFAAAYATLTEKVTVVDDPARGRLTGWSHSLGESGPSRPTSVGTAYGLHIMLDLGAPEGRLRTGDLVETLWRLRLPGGGWSARSQGRRRGPRSRLWCWARWPAPGRPATGWRRRWPGARPTSPTNSTASGGESTHVVTTVLRGLLRAAPDSAVLPVLREALADGAISDPRREHLRCWGYRLDRPYGLPSPLHTAQAVVALDRAARVLGEDEDEVVRAAREDGVRWLLACADAPHHRCQDLRNLREEVRRPRTDDPSRHEVLNVRHFTASWMIRALMTSGAREVAVQDGLEEAWRERLDGAAAAVWAGQTDGIWSWGRPDSSELRQPMWMTYQGLSALRAHAVWMYRPEE